MTKGINNRLLNDCYTTNTTMLAFGKTGISTIGCHRCINNLGMTKGINNRLLNDCYTTNTTMLAFGKTGISTIGCHRCINNLGMTVSCAVYKGFTVAYSTTSTGQVINRCICTIRFGFDCIIRYIFNSIRMINFCYRLRLGYFNVALCIREKLTA